MKKVTVVFLFSMLSVLCLFAQTKEKELTQAEMFGNQSGVLIEKQFNHIGKVKGVQVSVMKFIDLADSSSASAIRFEYAYKSTYSSDTKLALLDLDEIDGLIKSINLLQNNFDTSREVYSEITYRSRSGFQAGAYYSIDKKKWTTYIQIERFDSNSLVFLSVEEFSSLKALLEQAKALII